MTPSRPKHRFDVSIIMPVFNRSLLTRECLEALSRCDDQATYELIVVDNHSTDETPQVLQAIEGDVKVLREPVNRGFAAACNRGARIADGEFLVFLNNDTQPRSGWLDALVECARADESIGAVGAKLLYPEGDVQHAGVAISVKRIPYHVFQHFAADAPAVNAKRDMQAVTAACMLVPRGLFDEQSGFDETYQNGFEDVDFCLRLRESGYRVVYEPRCVVVHHEQATEGRKANDRENLERFMACWQNKLVADETELLAQHGLTITWEPGGGKYEQVVQSAPQREPVKNDVGSLPTIDEARAQYEEGRFDEAARTLQQVVESRMKLAGDTEFEVWQTLGNCYARLNRADDAEQAFLQAGQLDEQSERPYLGLGTVAMMQDNWQAAMYGFMMALAKNPTTAKGQFGVGLSMAARNMHRQAIDRFERVVEGDPFNREALFYLYSSAMAAGEPRRAISHLERYLENSPTDTSFLFNLCGACWKAGERTQALALCQRVLELDPHHAAAREVMQHLTASDAVHV